MKLDTTHLRYLTPEDWRVLTAVEIGSKNHEVIPTPLIIQIANLRSGSGAHKSISTLAKANLIARVQHAKYDGYRLTYGGLDYLALHTHFQRKTLHSTGPCIGTGKESDIHIVLAPPPPPPPPLPPTSNHPSQYDRSHNQQQQQQQQRQQLILKIHRLGRISFRTVKTNRDYLRHRSAATWLYMSRLSALKEHTFMAALHAVGFPVPEPVAWNRHTVVMSLVAGAPLYQIRHLEAEQAKRLYAELMAMVVRLAGVGLIHGDFNEFNVMVEERERCSEKRGGEVISDESESSSHVQGQNDAEPTLKNETTTTTTTLHPILIDFPQMLSISHPNAQTYFDRDVNCIKRYFARRYHFTSDDPGPFFADVEKQMRRNKGGGRRLDVEVEASGFSKKMAKELEKYMEDVGAEGVADDVDDDGNEDPSDESEELDESNDNNCHGEQR
ncbi:MAG: hypothetical protein Q9219_005879 [cf. Caloplaca sp. 3 TL-2023]